MIALALQLELGSEDTGKKFLGFFLERRRCLGFEILNYA
jgi:hypothetical protein